MNVFRIAVAGAYGNWFATEAAALMAAEAIDNCFGNALTDDEIKIVSNLEVIEVEIEPGTPEWVEAQACGVIAQLIENNRG